jgi:hypothetical protein
METLVVNIKSAANLQVFMDDVKNLDFMNYDYIWEHSPQNAENFIGLFEIIK